MVFGIKCKWRQQGFTQERKDNPSFKAAFKKFYQMKQIPVNLSPQKGRIEEMVLNSKQDVAELQSFEEDVHNVLYLVRPLPPRNGDCSQSHPI